MLLDMGFLDLVVVSSSSQLYYKVHLVVLFSSFIKSSPLGP